MEGPKKQLFKHWARPIFLQYEYLYNYRHNYYDDYIDYLDKRARGLDVRPPPPQTWAERALRTKVRDPYPYTSTLRYPRLSPDTAALLNTPHVSNTWHSVHSKDFYNRKYKSILF